MKRKNTWLSILCCALAGVSMLLAGCPTGDDSDGGGGGKTTTPANDSFQLSITQPDGGAITTSPAAGGKIKKNTPITVTVTPEYYGYKAGEVKVNGEAITPGTNGVYAFPMPGAAATVTATIVADPAAKEIETKAVSATGATLRDTIALTVENKNVKVKDRAYKDDVINVTADKLTGFEDNIGITVASGTETIEFADGKFTMPEGDVTITATYTLQAGYYSISLAFDEVKGNISTEPSDSAEKEKPVTITVTALPGYDVDEVSVVKLSDSTVELTLTPGTEANTWTFTMPEYDVKVIATFKADASIKYTVSKGNMNPSHGDISFEGLDADNKAAATTTITVTATPAGGYKTAGAPTSAPSVTFTPGSAADTWTFEMPASNITVTVTFEQIEVVGPTLYTVSKGSLSNGNDMSFTGVNAASKAEATTTITVTANPASGYEVDNEPTSTPSVTFTKTVENTWTFPMPAHDITVTVAFKVKTYMVNKGSLSNGDISFTGLTDGKAAATTTITVTANPDPGYEVNGLPSSTPSVLFTPAGTDTWTFSMPASAITVNVAFKVKSKPPYVVFSSSNGGLRSGVSVTRMSNHGYWSDPATTVEVIADGGRGGTGPALKLNNGGETGFALTDATPLNLASNNLVALSFWIKSGNNRNVQLMGFGDAGTRTSPTEAALNPPDKRANVWLQDVSYSTATNTDGWVRYIVPVPSNKKISIKELFAFKSDGQTGEYVLFDDIEFITTDVTVTAINMSNTLPSSIDMTAQGLLFRPFNLSTLLQPVITSVVYNTPIGNVIITSGGYGGLTDKITWDNWLVYSASGDGVIENGNMGVPTRANSTFDVRIDLGGITSSATTFTTPATKERMFEDFTSLGSWYGGYITDILNSDADRGFWMVKGNTGPNNSILGDDGSGGGYRGDNNDYDNVQPTGLENRRIMKIQPKPENLTAVGRNFPVSLFPEYIAHNDVISLRFRVTNATTNTYAFVLYNGGTAGQGYNDENGAERAVNGTGFEVAITNPAADTWIWIDIPITSFTNQAGFDPTAITGWAIRTKNNGNPQNDVGRHNFYLAGIKVD